MSEALERLRAANRADVTLQSGLNVTIRLPDLQECLVAGEIPFPVLQKMTAQATNGNGKAKASEPDLSSADLRHMIRYQRELIRAAVVGIDGEALTEPLTDEDITDVFTDTEDRAEVVAYAQREKPLPGKA